MISSKKIFYKNDSSFIIFPQLAINDLFEFKKFMNMVMKTYNDKCFFWFYNERNNSINVDQSSNIVDNDIYNQLMSLVYWLFQRNYNVKGSFFCQIENLSEFILLNGVDNSVLHYTFMDHCDIIHNNYSTIETQKIEELKKKLEMLEDKINNMSKTNFIWNLCNIISFIAIGSFFIMGIGHSNQTESSVVNIVNTN